MDQASKLLSNASPLRVQVLPHDAGRFRVRWIVIALALLTFTRTTVEGFASAPYAAFLGVRGSPCLLQSQFGHFPKKQLPGGLYLHE